MIRRILQLPRRVKQALLVGYDAVGIPVVLWLAWSLRIDGLMADASLFAAVAALMFCGSMLLFSRLGLYRAVLRYESEHAGLQVIKAVGASSLILLVLGVASGGAVPRSLFAGYFVFGVLVLGGGRWLAWRLLNREQLSVPRLPVAIYGAGSCGRQLAGMLRQSGDLRPVAFIDDDPGLHERQVHGLDVFSPQSLWLKQELQRRGVGEILLAIPSLKPSRRRQILEVIEPLGLHVKTVPHLELLLSGAPLNQLRDVSIEDLLGRDPVAPVDGLLGHCIEGRVVLVTGGGGSIGSEICRQALRLGAKRLIVVDHSEFALYQIGEELRGLLETQATPATPRQGVSLRCVLGSVTDHSMLEELFAGERVDTVYHAAAYKHVPIVEASPFEGVHNNALGTLAVAEVAASFGVRNFVLVSTDKAVRPTNVMGATKRVAELLVQGVASRYPGMACAIVRFGNVLGSSGSVVPLFRRQIEQGGPITLTHEAVTRYFMTIPEAVGLVIQAGSMGTAGDVFLLDMGEPVRIRSLAERMVHLSGLSLRTPENPDGEIEIRVTGMRPGEKLFEELLVGDCAEATLHPRIFRDGHGRCGSEEAQKIVERLRAVLAARDRRALASLLCDVVHGYVASDPALASLPIGSAGTLGASGTPVVAGSSGAPVKVVLH